MIAADKEQELSVSIALCDRIHNVLGAMADVLDIEMGYAENGQLEEIASLVQEKDFLSGIIFQYQLEIAAIVKGSATALDEEHEKSYENVRASSLRLLEISEKNILVMTKKLHLLGTMIKSTKKAMKSEAREVGLYGSRGKNLDAKNEAMPYVLNAKI